MKRASTVIEKMRGILNDIEFVSQHKKNCTAFTRTRKLTFVTVVSTILSLAKRSLQIECNLLGEHQMSEPASKQAFSKARYKVRHTAFKALNDAFLQETYSNNFEGLWKGYRLFGVDGSTIRLPESQENAKYFGRHNSGGFNKRKDPILARISEVVDLTTGIVVDAAIAPIIQAERTLAYEQLTIVTKLFKGLNQQNMLFVFDRGYISKEWMKKLISLGTDFIFRVPRSCNKMIDLKTFQDECDCIIDVLPDLPALRLIVRFLSSGERCVLLTSLTDQTEMQTDDLMHIYWLRWSGCEEGYKKQKVALELENFLGNGVEAVLQEFWATVLTINMFQLHCLEAEGAWDIDNPPTERINRCVVFGSLRKTVFKMIMGEVTASDFWELFIRIASRAKVKVRPGRQYTRTGLKKEKHVFRRVC